MTYNYLESIKADVKNYIDNEITLKDFTDREELEQKLNDDLWTEDSVTGNASGSYTFNRYQAEENVTDNMDLLEEMCKEFGIEAETIGQKFLDCEWEWMDVSIRCYLLGQAIAEILEEMEEELEEAFADDEE